MESGDLTALVIRALCQVAVTAVSAIKNRHSQWTCKTKELVEAAKSISIESELDLDPERINGRRIGRTLAKMRFKQEPRPKKQGDRQWLVSLDDLTRWANLYALADWLPSDTNGGNGGNGSNDDRCDEEKANGSNGSNGDRAETSESEQEQENTQARESSTDSYESLRIPLMRRNCEHCTDASRSLPRTRRGTHTDSSGDVESESAGPAPGHASGRTEATQGRSVGVADSPSPLR